MKAISLALAILFAIAGECSAQQLIGRLGYSAPTYPSTTIVNNQSSTTDILVSLSPYGNVGLTYGVDYTQSATYYSNALPAQTQFVWSWPLTGRTGGGVYCYNSLQFGNYFYNNRPAVPFKQISAISSLIGFHNVSTTGNATVFNIIYDLFLTSTASALGNGGTKVYEIEILLNQSTDGQSYINNATQLGTYTDAQGLAWQAAVDITGKDILFARVDNSQVYSGQIDMKAIFIWLIGKGTLTGNEYFGGVALGNETVLGSGTLTVNAFDVIYQ